MEYPSFNWHVGRYWRLGAVGRHMLDEHGHDNRRNDSHDGGRLADVQSWRGDKLVRICLGGEHGHREGVRSAGEYAYIDDL